VLAERGSCRCFDDVTPQREVARGPREAGKETWEKPAAS